MSWAVPSRRDTTAITSSRDSTVGNRRGLRAQTTSCNHSSFILSTCL
jgi:hypothetical protein